MALIVLLILTEDQLFNKTVHNIILKGATWYQERVVSEISLGGLIILVTTRTAQFNLLKMRVSYYSVLVSLLKSEIILSHFVYRTNICI